MITLPSAAGSLLLHFSPVFRPATFRRWLVLLTGAVLTTGRRTVSNVLRTVKSFAPGDPSSYHRVFSKRRWSMWRLARALATFILDHWVRRGVVRLAGDDTVDEHRGKKVYGKGCHRDAVRSTHSFTAFRWGHKWVVLCILVSFPFASRPWALPVLVALYRTKEWNKKYRRGRHRTMPALMRQLVKVLVRWFPERRFLLALDGGYATHDLARLGSRLHPRLTVISRFYQDAALYAPPPDAVRSGRRVRGRPRTKGRRTPTPRQAVAKAKRERITTRWYGGGRRRVEVVTGTGGWFKSGAGLVEVRWVFVHDRTGTHRDEYFFSTDTDMTPKEIIGEFTGRWSIETMFQEMRAYLGLETTCGRTENTVLRMAPSLFGLFSVVALLYAGMPRQGVHGSLLGWVGKRHVTFSDAITAVRRWIWVDWIIERTPAGAALRKFPRTLRNMLIYALAPAA